MSTPTSETLNETLADCVRALKCRKGPATGTTKRGAFWLAKEPICIRHAGGDGVGNNGPDRKFFLELRHYRDGSVRCMVHEQARHENGEYGGAGNWYRDAGLENCRTAEEMQVQLLNTEMSSDRGPVYSVCFAEDIERLAGELGLSVALPAPDEA